MENYLQSNYIKGALDGLHLAWNLRIENLVLEMDSTEAIQLIQTNSTEQHHSVVLRAIKDLLQLDWMIQIKHEFREGNKVTYMDDEYSDLLRLFEYMGFLQMPMTYFLAATVDRAWKAEFGNDMSFTRL
ncbi:hypothetical protein J1N35_029289 [Gossypium stocksii]|uniref:RNase H type-1 domain-containing protein n=1 Tax=Gossypium stocksii TaxID=47602 RepID=A0A9D3UYL9_9ROSI|nr:hypothetical protein J1N35_029289 [Gossypium stocksii]